MSDVHEGGCLCGAVRYRADGAPSTAFVCHCTFCQRASGSAFQIGLFFARDQVEIHGELATYDHVSPAHGRTLHLRFCPRCGTRLAIDLERAPQLLVIAGGTFDDPNWFEVQLHMFTESAVRWMAVPPDVRCYVQHFLTEQGERLKPLPRQSVPFLLSGRR